MALGAESRSSHRIAADRWDRSEPGPQARRAAANRPSSESSAEPIAIDAATDPDHEPATGLMADRLRAESEAPELESRDHSVLASSEVGEGSEGTGHYRRKPRSLLPAPASSGVQLSSGGS
jgi:hypothetical protein